jgi:proteasome activator subunit 4
MFSLCFICKEFCRERKAHPVWFFAPVESYKLTEQDITDFVHCVKEYAFISIFNKSYAEEATKACQYLSILRPELIVPSIVEKYDILCVMF